ncbi:hypothetical protein [Amycolatopsis japonica]|uniref:hypothetical protein n=1 Tax=Amycolatopsis japonica TaxID=208439 RepID=UPI00380E129F
MTTFWTIVVGVLSSVVASAVWLVALRGLRPAIEISPLIAQDPERSNSYHVKIINRSRRALVDVSFDIAIIRIARTRGGTVDMRKTVRVAGPPPLIIPARKKDGTDNIYRLRVDADLRGTLEIDDRHSVRIRIFARDAWSGVGRVAERRYHDPGTEIAVGKYAKGSTFDVV